MGRLAYRSNERSIGRRSDTGGRQHRVRPLVDPRRGLTKRYGLRTVLAGIDLDLAAGQTLLVTGPNGSGKTTLLRLLAGLAAPSSGALEVAPSGATSATSATSRSSTAS